MLLDFAFELATQTRGTVQGDRRIAVRHRSSSHTRFVWVKALAVWLLRQPATRGSVYHLFKIMYLKDQARIHSTVSGYLPMLLCSLPAKTIAQAWRLCMAPSRGPRDRASTTGNRILDQNSLLSQSGDIPDDTHSSCIGCRKDAVFACTDSCTLRRVWDRNFGFAREENDISAYGTLAQCFRSEILRCVWNEMGWAHWVVDTAWAPSLVPTGSMLWVPLAKLPSEAVYVPEVPFSVETLKGWPVGSIGCSISCWKRPWWSS